MSHSRASARVVFLFTALAIAAPARAELAFLSNGRNLSIKSHRVDGDSYVLMLRSGGEMVVATSTIARFAPDEVPYPEPEAPAPTPAVYSAAAEGVQSVLRRFEEAPAAVLIGTRWSPKGTTSPT